MSEPSKSSISFTTLTTPGASTAFELSTGRASKWFEITVASIGTNVVAQVEYSATSAFSTVSKKGTATTYLANGTYVLPVVDADQYVRLQFVSASGGTPTVAGALVERVAD